MKNISQLTLSVQLPDDETFDSYFSESNHSVLSQLKLFIDQNQVTSMIISFIACL